MSIFRAKTKLGLGSAHETCSPMKEDCRAGRTLRSDIRDQPRPTQRYPLAINHIETERNNKAELGTACACFGTTYTEIGTQHRSLKILSAYMKLGLPGTVSHRNLSLCALKTNAKNISRMPVHNPPDHRGICPSSERKQNLG